MEFDPDQLTTARDAALTDGRDERPLASNSATGIAPSAEAMLQMLGHTAEPAQQPEGLEALPPDEGDSPGNAGFSAEWGSSGALWSSLPELPTALDDARDKTSAAISDASSGQRPFESAGTGAAPGGWLPMDSPVLAALPTALGAQADGSSENAHGETASPPAPSEFSTSDATMPSAVDEPPPGAASDSQRPAPSAPELDFGGDFSDRLLGGMRVAAELPADRTGDSQRASETNTAPLEVTLADRDPLLAEAAQEIARIAQAAARALAQEVVSRQAADTRTMEAGRLAARSAIFG